MPLEEGVRRTIQFLREADWYRKSDGRALGLGHAHRENGALRVPTTFSATLPK
jgi:hypothetical protein